MEQISQFAKQDSKCHLTLPDLAEKKKSGKPTEYQTMQNYYRTKTKVKQLAQTYKLQHCSVYISERRFLLYEI